MTQPLSRLLLASCIASALLTVPAHATNLLDQVGQGVDKARQIQQDMGREKADAHRHGGRHEDGGPGCRNERSMRSIEGHQHTSVRFINERPHAIRTYWLDYNGRRVFYKDIASGSSYTQPTFRTHPWVITDERDQCLQTFVSQRRKEDVRISRGGR